MDGAEHLSVTRSPDPDWTVRVAGELDAYSAPVLEAELARHPSSGPVRLDLAGVTFIDSTGLRVVVAADNRLRAESTELVVVDPSPSVVRLLQLTSLDQRFRIEASS
jgi:anti-sigma B factor antagonist